MTVAAVVVPVCPEVEVAPPLVVGAEGGVAVAGDPAVVTVVPVPAGSEQADAPKTTTARPALPISAMAMRRLMRRRVVMGSSRVGTVPSYRGSESV
jgi:hypothetical protein